MLQDVHVLNLNYLFEFSVQVLCPDPYVELYK